MKKPVIKWVLILLTAVFLLHLVRNPEQILMIEAMFLWNHPSLFAFVQRLAALTVLEKKILIIVIFIGVILALGGLFLMALKLYRAVMKKMGRDAVSIYEDYDRLIREQADFESDPLRMITVTHYGDRIKRWLFRIGSVVVSVWVMFAVFERMLMRSMRPVLSALVGMAAALGVALVCLLLRGVLLVLWPSDTRVIRMRK